LDLPRQEAGSKDLLSCSELLHFMDWRVAPHFMDCLQVQVGFIQVAGTSVA